jgi:hypothetical protein
VFRYSSRFGAWWLVRVPSAELLRGCCAKSGCGVSSSSVKGGHRSCPA